MADASDPARLTAGASAARGRNLFEADVNLQRLLARRAPALLDRHRARLSAFGHWAGAVVEPQAEATDRFFPPRLDAAALPPRVIFNPDYLACHAEAYRRGMVGLPYAEAGTGHAICFAMGYLLSQVDIAIHCPVTMTGAVAHVLDTRAPAELKRRYLPDLTRMDGGALSGGTWATELHGGSDVGATTTRAEATNEGFRLHGLKWFTSNAGAGLALATARPDPSVAGGKGLGCYLVPSHLSDGAPNRHRIRRLKEKAGTRGLATAELDLDGTLAFEVAAAPDGLKAMLAALEYSRIHNAMSSAGLLRRALVEAVAWAKGRHAFGQAIAGFAMMQDQLLDLVTDAEAAAALAFECAFTFDAGEDDWLRVATALAKYRTAELAVAGSAQAVAIVGGNGYTEEWPTARLYRDALVTAVWEGPANIQALELLRLVTGARPGDQHFLARIDGILGALPTAMAAIAAPLAALSGQSREALSYLRANPAEGPRHGRRLLDLLADNLALALLAEEAAADLAAGDRRKLLIAGRLAARLSGRTPVGPAADPAQAAFQAVIACRPV